MLQYIVRRLLLMVPTLIGMTLIVFMMARFAPGLTGGGQFGEGGGRNARENRELARVNLLKKLGMMDADGKELPLYYQYWRWLKGAATFQFGESVKYGEPVSKLIGNALPVTLTMNVIATLVVYGLALPGGMLAAVKRGKWFDEIWSFVTLALFSLPVIWIGNLAIFELAYSKNLAWFPAGNLHSADTRGFTWLQYSTDYLWHLVLPIAVSCLGGFAYLSKLMRASMISNMYEDYARTARAKGVSQFYVVVRHVLRNSLLPMITVFALVIPGLLGGSLVIEYIFNIPGMGQLGVTAAQSRDLPVLQALTFIGSLLSLICLLLADICYAIADPRVSYE